MCVNAATRSECVCIFKSGLLYCTLSNWSCQRKNNRCGIGKSNFKFKIQRFFSGSKFLKIIALKKLCWWCSKQVWYIFLLGWIKKQLFYAGFASFKCCKSLCVYVKQGTKLKYIRWRKLRWVEGFLRQSTNQVKRQNRKKDAWWFEEEAKIDVLGQ